MDSLDQGLARDLTGLDQQAMGHEIYSLASRLFPLCRSITGKGVRQTLDILGDYIDLDRKRIASGTVVFDWTVPKEWIARDAYIVDPFGNRIADFKTNNLHLMSYSVPVRRVMPLSELREHIYTLPAQPDLIPYKTAYYTDAWAFCMTHNAFKDLKDGDYEVVVDTEKVSGHLEYGEYLHKGESSREVVLYTHICHPSLANDNCSGLALLTCLAASMRGMKTHYSYRFVFAPGTIGSLSWLFMNETGLSDIAHGLVVSCVGDGAPATYKKSRRGDATIDRVAACTRCGDPSLPLELKDFSPYGYDERQFCSPGFDLPFGLFQRSVFGTFPEYHTSADNLDFIRPEHLATSLSSVKDIIAALEGNWMPMNLSPKGEPHLSKHGLFSTIGGHKPSSDRMMAYLWVLNQADGRHSLLDISERAKLPFSEIAAAADALRQAGLVSNLGAVWD
jgi:aminopeptidase-like protein